MRRNGPPSNGSSSSGHTWLTEAGQALLPLCNNILAVAGETIRAVADLRAAHTGRVMLAASQTVGTYVMPRLLAAFRLRNPGVSCTPSHYCLGHCIRCILEMCSCQVHAAFWAPQIEPISCEQLTISAHVSEVRQVQLPTTCHVYRSRCT